MNDEKPKGFTSPAEEMQQLGVAVPQGASAGLPLKRRKRTLGDHVAAGLRRIWDNMWVFWLGSMAGAMDVKHFEDGGTGRALLVFAAALAVFGLGAWFVRAQERRAARR